MEIGGGGGSLRNGGEELGYNLMATHSPSLYWHGGGGILTARLARHETKNQPSVTKLEGWRGGLYVLKIYEYVCF